jgi:orotidine-5'-phosphate decarboxylase
MTAFQNLTTPQKIVLAIDTADPDQAQKLIEVAKHAGARFVKFGLQLATAKGWDWCAKMAQKSQLDWIADAKLDDIPNTVTGGIKSMKQLDHPPVGITIHATIGRQGMADAQTAAGDIVIFGVTVLTSLSDEESREIYGAPVAEKVIELSEAAAEAGLKGLVASPLEVQQLKSNSHTKSLITLIPGSRSKDAKISDQARIATPIDTIKAGADLLVIGREITQADDPAAAYDKIIKDIEES